MFDENVGSKILSQHPGWASMMRNILRVPRKEVLYRDGSRSRPRNRAMWRPEQKNVWMEVLMRRLSRPVDMVMNSCAGMCSTANVCMLHAEYRKFVKCDVDYELLTAAETDPVLTFVSQLPKPESDISGSAAVKVAAMVLKEERAALLASTKASAWEVLHALDATQMLPGHVLRFISMTFMNHSLYEISRHIPLNMWSQVLRSRLYSTDRRALLTQQCSLLRVSVRRSTVCYEKARSGLFPLRSFVKKM